jgi:hypothetical protein
MKGERAIIAMIEDIYESAGLEKEYFSDDDLKALCRAVVSAYVAKTGNMLARGKRVEFARVKFAFDVMQATSGAATKDAPDLSRFQTVDLLRQVAQWTQ